MKGVKLAKAIGKGLGKSLMVLGGVAGLTSLSFGFTAPTSTGFIYDAYDILVNKMIKGPIGTAAGVGLIAFGVYNLIMNRWVATVSSFVGGGLLIKADAVAQSLGMTINNF